jgi:hypothetical protein
VNRRPGVVLTVTLCACAGYTMAGERAADLRTRLLVPHPVTSRAPASPVDPLRSGWSTSTALPGEPPDRPVQDLYGNDVNDAVARYKFDAEGTVYEEHSPETEIPHLRPPTT